MTWDDGLLPEQRTAASHVGAPARLLAGPGTGKTLTLTRHISFLVNDQHIQPDAIAAITFTRAAARELRQRVEAELDCGNMPRISTLHSFALRQLLRNAPNVTALPRPLRIADDWEERNIILEDLKTLLDMNDIGDARDLLNELSAVWQSLTADDENWERRFPNPRFLAAWREHRTIFGYSLRAELVYQLKKALEQIGGFRLDGNICHLLVDEYQDLNRCDLAVVHEIVSRGVELFVAGDDDQSIYGFRKAHPQGIRRFPQDYDGARLLPLEVCKRCDREILNIGLFVARQDPRRLDKSIRPEAGRQEGEVRLIRFRNQDLEASGITAICGHLISHHGLRPDNILVLLRSDHNAAFTGPIREALANAGLQASAGESSNALDQKNGRALLAFLRLATNQEDHLAWRTLFMNWCPGVGKGAITALYDIARSRSEDFARTVLSVNHDPDILPSVHRTRVGTAITNILLRLGGLFPVDPSVEHATCAALMEVVSRAAESIILDDVERAGVLNALALAAQASCATSLKELVRAIGVTGENIEQEIEQGRVNILTMHKAKGLTAETVIVAAAEDEYLPGRAIGEGVEDERRLLYVSLTRAKHHLFVTYCDQRTGRQRHTGRNGSHAARSLTRFLRDGPLTPVDGITFINALAEEQQ